MSDCVAAGIAGFVFLLAVPARSASLTVEEGPERIVVVNDFYKATILRARGGLISEIAIAGGMVVIGEHALYTDRGIYGDGVNVSSANELQPDIQVSRRKTRLTIQSRGTLRGTGELANPEQRLDYLVTYSFDYSPTIGVQLSVTPSFSLEAPDGFFSYIMHVPTYTEWFAKTMEGVIFQPASGTNGRCFQSANEPLDLDDPWMGLLLPEGSIVALSNVQGDPAFGNVFMHESAARSTALFCAWFSGPAGADFSPGTPWTGQFRLHVWPKGLQRSIDLPDFLGYVW